MSSEVLSDFQGRVDAFAEQRGYPHYFVTGTIILPAVGASSFVLTTLDESAVSPFTSGNPALAVQIFRLMQNCSLPAHWRNLDHPGAKLFNSEFSNVLAGTLADAVSCGRVYSARHPTGSHLTLALMGRQPSNDVAELDDEGERLVLFSIRLLSDLVRVMGATRRVGDLLTDKQVETLQLLATVRSLDEVAARMGIARRGVDRHLQAAIRALNVETREQAIISAERLGLFMHQRRPDTERVVVLARRAS